MKRIGLVRKKYLTKERIYQIIDYLTTNEKKRDWSAHTERLWKQFLSKKDENVDRIYNQLNNQTWVPGEFSIFEKKEGKKLRKIYESEPEDLLVDTLWFQCLMYVFFEKKKIIPETCYGSIKNKGQHEIRKKIIDLVKHRTNLMAYVGDTRQYYPTISHKILYDTFKQHIKDKWLLWLCRVCIDRMPGDTGVALGLPSSNPIGHIYHAVIDWYVVLTLKCKRYYRFCDDIWIFHKDGKYLHTVARELIHETQEKLCQNIKKDWRIVNCKEERFECLGALINSHGARLRKFSRQRIEQHMKDCIKKGDPDKALRTWSGVKGSMKDLNVENLINYWKEVYPEFFHLLRWAYEDLLEHRRRKRWHKRLEKILRTAEDCRSELNQYLYPYGFQLPEKREKIETQI